MHDEASTYYVDMIDQTALGHRYIRDQFGQFPRVGWQIDPFGHSAVQASLLTAEVTTRLFSVFSLQIRFYVEKAPRQVVMSAAVYESDLCNACHWESF